MNRIALIGNGFDLAHGLPTRYTDFLSDFWKSFIKEALNKVNVFEKECVQLNFGRRNLTLNMICNGDIPVGLQKLNEIISDYYRIQYNNSGDSMSLKITNYLFKHICELDHIENWVDIENEYYKYLCYKFSQENAYGQYALKVELLNKHLNFIKDKLSDYLANLIRNIEIKRIEKIFEICYATFKPKELSYVGMKFSADNEFWKIKREKDGISDIFKEEMSPKSKPLLDSFDNFTDNEVKDNIFYLHQDDESVKNFFDFQPQKLLLLNFNYTDIEKFYLHEDEKFESEVIHIHGELNNPSNPIIFGYGDEFEDNYKKLENLQDNKFLENIKSIKYLETDNYKRLLSFIESDKYQIIILGHSCGNSDRTLLNTLFEHENCVSIKPYYYQYKDNGMIKDNYSEIVRNISRSFTDKKSMRDKVVNKTYTDWFSKDMND